MNFATDSIMKVSKKNRMLRVFGTDFCESQKSNSTQISLEKKPYSTVIDMQRVCIKRLPGTCKY